MSAAVSVAVTLTCLHKNLYKLFRKNTGRDCNKFLVHTKRSHALAHPGAQVINLGLRFEPKPNLSLPPSLENVGQAIGPLLCCSVSLLTSDLGLAFRGSDLRQAISL